MPSRMAVLCMQPLQAPGGNTCGTGEVKTITILYGYATGDCSLVHIGHCIHVQMFILMPFL